MGRNKLTLPWGRTTVLGQILATLEAVGVRPVVVVTAVDMVETVQAVVAAHPTARLVAYKPPDPDAMLASLQQGLVALSPDCTAALVVLGDQPHIPPEVYRVLLHGHEAGEEGILMPTYQGRRGHPWLLSRSLWPRLLAMPPSATLRDFVEQHRQWLREIPVPSPAILQDMDTPEDYCRLLQTWQPGAEP